MENKTSKFKVGDKVVCIGHPSWSEAWKRAIGIEFVITPLDQRTIRGCGNYHFLDNKYGVNFSEDSLELINDEWDE